MGWHEKQVASGNNKQFLNKEDKDKLELLSWGLKKI
jgi:hypothetical protein